MELFEIWNVVNTNPVLITILGIIATFCAIYCKKQKSEKELTRAEQKKAQKDLSKQHKKVIKTESKLKKEYRKEEELKEKAANDNSSH